MFAKNMLSDRVGGLAAIILGIVSTMEGVRLYPLRQSTMVGDHTMPIVLGIVLILLGALMFIIKQGHFEVVFPPKDIRRTMMISMVLLFFYAFCIEYLGYLISTILVNIGLFRVFGSYKWLKCIVMSITFAICLYLVFILWLKMPFPTGVLLDI